MSSRAEEKAQRRAAREAEQARQQSGDQRRKRLGILGGVLALAAVVVVVAVVLSQSGTDDEPAAGGGGGAAAAALVDGIAQRGQALGDADAPVTIEEYVDYQCPFCGEFSTKVFPTVLEDYVKTGKVRIVLRTQAFLGEDSVKAARFAAAAGQQNRQWQFTEAFYAQQGEENSGYVTDEFLRKVAADAAVDYAKAAAAADTEKISAVLVDASNEAQRKGMDSTPAFAMGATGGRLLKVETDALDAAAFSQTIDEQLALAEK